MLCRDSVGMRIPPLGHIRGIDRNRSFAAQFALTSAISVEARLSCVQSHSHDARGCGNACKERGERMKTKMEFAAVVWGLVIVLSTGIATAQVSSHITTEGTMKPVDPTVRPIQAPLSPEEQQRLAE